MTRAMVLESFECRVFRGKKPLTLVQCRQLLHLVHVLQSDRMNLSKLASKKPEFFNPLCAFAAESLRDRVLQDDMAAIDEQRMLGQTEGECLNR